MSNLYIREGLNLQGLIIEKSKAIVHANDLKAQGFRAEAGDLFEEAAQMEEQIVAIMKDSGEEDWYIAALSAASCWTQAGELSQALDNYLLVLRKRPDINICEDILWFFEQDIVRDALSVTYA